MEKTLTIPLPPFPPCGPDEKWVQVAEGKSEPGDFFVGHRNEWCGPMQAGAGGPVRDFLCLIRRVRIDPRDAEIERLTKERDDLAVWVSSLQDDLKHAHDALRPKAAEAYKLRELLIDEVCLRLAPTPFYRSDAKRGDVMDRKDSLRVWCGSRWRDWKHPESRATLREVHGAAAEKIVAAMLGGAK